MNIVDNLQHELNELEPLEKRVRARLDRLQAIPFDHWTPEQAREYDQLDNYHYDILARQSQLEQDLAKAIYRQRAQHRAYRETHPTLADIWPKGAT